MGALDLLQRGGWAVGAAGFLTAVVLLLRSPPRRLPESRAMVALAGSGIFVLALGLAGAVLAGEYTAAWATAALLLGWLVVILLVWRLHRKAAAPRVLR